MKRQQIGVIGVSVMGKNLAFNIESKGYGVSVYDLFTEKTDELLNEAQCKNIQGTYSIEEFVNSLEKPRKIILMIKAGKYVDDTIEQLKPFLTTGDVIVEGGNSFFEDTRRRSIDLEELGVRFVGAGISGGEEGARKGPAIMPGGHKEAYLLVKPILESIAAKVDEDPCCKYIGPDGAGHYVKMIHNGIEYGDMQLISEAYHILKNVLGLSTQELHEVFFQWNHGELDSYLIDITQDIFTKYDPDTGKPMVDIILDTAGQKGTGKWTSQSALDLGVAIPTITEAVFARYMSGKKQERIAASTLLKGPSVSTYAGDKKALIESIRKALYASKICSYAQGFSLLKAASEEYDWNLNYGEIAMIFRGGCIIRAQFLNKITEAYNNNPALGNLMLDPYFKDILESYQSGLRETICTAITYGVPTPGLSSALAYYDSYRTEILPANLLQAQRDYFGAHTFERVDKEGIFHHQWL